MKFCVHELVAWESWPTISRMTTKTTRLHCVCHDVRMKDAPYAYTNDAQPYRTRTGVGRYCFADLPFDEYEDVGFWGTTVPRAKIVKKGMGPWATVFGGRKFGTI